MTLFQRGKFRKVHFRQINDKWPFIKLRIHFFKCENCVNWLSIENNYRIFKRFLLASFVWFDVFYFGNCKSKTIQISDEHSTDSRNPKMLPLLLEKKTN